MLLKTNAKNSSRWTFSKSIPLSQSKTFFNPKNSLNKNPWMLWGIDRYVFSWSHPDLFTRIERDLQRLYPVRTQSSSCATLYFPNICMWPNLALNYIKSLYNTQICPIIVFQKGFPTLSKFKKASTSNNSSLSLCKQPRKTNKRGISGIKCLSNIIFPSRAWRYSRLRQHCRPQRLQHI